MLPASASPSSSSPSASDSFRRLSNGKFVCLACPHRPVLDSPLMLSRGKQISKNARSKNSGSLLQDGSETAMEDDCGEREKT
ncbi:hypothetical protein E2562_009748 [Oryza meyeriana var. granulata]|uniref:Sodium channel modifier 1 zinc-finger domain-containing protein n=1 Tax=Oryza meyeriana var. granulata TaxID=110450 RepID=A0A6G1D1V4_9ORYZ|nr:hypothetical protein E2562_009748 [Oryza meyeriana var. granulata]